MGLHTREHRHLDYDKAASAIFTEPEIADVGLAEAEAFAAGRKIRVTKVPFSANAKALINDDPRGFVKIVSDPATGVVLGGSIVGRHAAELISVIALAVTAGLQVDRHRREPARAPRRWPRPWPTPPSSRARCRTRLARRPRLPGRLAALTGARRRQRDDRRACRRCAARPSTGRLRGRRSSNSACRRPSRAGRSRTPLPPWSVADATRPCRSTGAATSARRP